MANFFLGAALQGLGAGGAAYGGALAREQEQQRKLDTDLEYKLALLEARKSAGAVGGGGASKRATFDPAIADQQLAFASGMSPDQQAKLQDGSLFDRARQLQNPVANDDDGNPLPDPGGVTERLPGWEALRARKLDELKGLREAIALGGDYKEVTEGRLNEQKRGQLDRYEGGSDRAGQAVTIGAKGSIFDGDSNVTRNEVTGATKTTPVGDAEVKKKGSEVRENDAQSTRAYGEATKALMEAAGGGAGGGVKAASVERLSTQLNSVNAAIKDLSDPSKQPRQSASPEEKQAHADALKMYRSIQAAIAREMNERVGGGAAAPAKPASAGEQKLKAQVALSPAEQAASDAREASPSNLRTLEAAVRAEKNPASRATLQAELERQRASAAKLMAGSGGMARPQTAAERDALPRGTRYMDPSGTVRIKG